MPTRTAAEAYTLIVDPPAVPAVADLRPLRQSKNLTLKTVANQFSTWRATISRIERGVSHDEEFANAYRRYLSEAA